jgi:hypothetical protein
MQIAKERAGRGYRLSSRLPSDAVTTPVPGDPRAAAEATQVGHALIMVAELPAHTENTTYPDIVRIACIDAYFTNVRLLIEFFVQPHKKKRIHRYDYLHGWDPADPIATKLRTEWYGFVSQNTSHLAKARIPTTNSPVINIAGRRLTHLAGDVLTVAEEFAEALANAASPWAQTFAAYARNARAHQT